MLVKTIVLATDLPHNVQAANYAHELAKKLNARLVLVHACGPETETDGGETLVPLRLTRLRQRLMRINKGSVDISIIAKVGEPLASIQTAVVEEKADLLVMALAGADPLRVRFEGSLTTHLISQTSVSMLILPPGSLYKPIRTIALALDLSEAIDAVTLGRAKVFVQALGATLDIICMNDEPDGQQHEAARQIQGLFGNLTQPFSFWPGNDLATTLDDYLITHPADLIMLLPKHRNRFDTWLMESVTQQVARQAVIPVLAVV